MARPFEHLTAKAICGQCVVREECLVDAIESPNVIPWGEHLIRGGESGRAIHRMRREDADGGKGKQG